MLRTFPILSLILILCLSSLKAAPGKILREYIQHLKNREWDRARDCWHPGDIEKSRWLGIEYTGVPLKIECASPLISALDGIRSGAVKVDISSVPESDSTARVIVTLSYNGREMQIPYYTVSDGKSWRIISPLILFTSDWPVYPGEYTNVHCRDSILYNSYAASVLDREIGQIGGILGLDDSDFKLLQSNKIDYYLCTEDQFMRLTGYNAHGLTVLPFDAVVTRHLPHPHELVHLLINYSLKKLPLYEIPFMQEGLAVAYGGRWGKSPDVIKQLGFTILDNDMFTLEDILTYDNFYNKIGSPDISYPIAGIFVEMLIDQVGIDKFKRLYLDLAGTESQVEKFTREEIFAKLEQDTGLLRENLLRLFNEQWPRYEYSGLIPGNTGINSATNDSAYPSGDSGYRIADLNGMYRFEITFSDSLDSGALLFRDTGASARVSHSKLFNDLVPGIEYEGWEYGIIFDRNEVGLYDFRTNTLTAKHVESFAPDRGYIESGENGNRYLFRIEKKLFEKQMLEYESKLKFISNDS